MGREREGGVHESQGEMYLPIRTHNIETCATRC